MTTLRILLIANLIVGVVNLIVQIKSGRRDGVKNKLSIVKPSRNWAEKRI